MSQLLKASICIATRDKAKYLARTLTSISEQRADFNWECIVVDDGSKDETHSVLHKSQSPWMVGENGKIVPRGQQTIGANLKVWRIEPENGRFNPALPRNVAYRHARGEILVCMSDDVMLSTPATLQQLVGSMQPGTFCIATVHNYDADRQKIVQFVRETTQLTGLENQRPFFFLGAVYRRDVYAVGGCDERFIGPAFDDDRMRDSLIRGLSLKPVFLPDVIGYHQDHPRAAHYHTVQQSRRLYRRITHHSEMTGDWFSPGAPWQFHE